jgi:signal transduction histidine kinase
VLIEPELSRRELKLCWHSTIEGTVDVAATETRQIALNLLLNACEASLPGGEVSFRAWIGGTADHEGPIELNLEVVDAGSGLPPAVADTLTTDGMSEPRSSHRGLGIHVVRDLVTSLGGRIVATAGVGKRGSCIVVTLPPGGRTRGEIAA